MVRQDLVEDDDHGFPALEQGWESDLGLDLNVSRKVAYHGQCDGVCTRSRLAFHKKLRYGQAQDHMDQNDLKDVDLELVLRVEKGHVCLLWRSTMSDRGSGGCGRVWCYKNCCRG